MPAIQPLHPVVTATKEEHIAMAKDSLAKVYANANITDIVSSNFWSDVSSMHGFIAGMMD